MELLTEMLNNVPDSYYGFVAAILSYVRENPENIDIIVSFMKEHPGATTSDIGEFVIGLPGFIEEEEQEEAS